MDDGIEAALEQFCFFVNNKSRDEEIEHLKRTASNASTTRRKPSLSVSLMMVQSLKVFYNTFMRNVLSHTSGKF